jgi:heme-degrading monooxygenase HmoA
MFVNLSVMKPNPGHEDALADSMRRYRAAARTQAGLTLCANLRNDDTGDLVGLAVWESAEAAQAAEPALQAAVADDDFATWVANASNSRLREI